MQTKLTKIDKSTAFVEIVASAEDIKHEEEHSVAHLAESTTIKGFRKGKAPLSVVKSSLDPSKIKDHTVSHILGNGINQAIKEHKLKAIGDPKLTKNESKGSDSWTFNVELPLYPEIVLGDYQDRVKKAYAKQKPKDDDVKLKIAFDTLLDTTKFEVAQSMVDEEVNRSLVRLVQQTETLNLSVEEYLKSIKKTAEELRVEYHKTAEESLKLDFLLFAVASDLKVTVNDTEVLELEKASQTKEEQRPYLKTVLLRRKAVDALLKL